MFGFLTSRLLSLVLVAYALCVCGTNSVSAAGLGTVGIAPADTPIYEGRSTNSPIVGLMEAGGWLVVDHLSAGYYAVYSPYQRWRTEERAIGYVRAAKVETAEVLIADWENLSTVDSLVNVRAARDANAAVVAKLKPHSRVQAKFLKDGWVAVYPPDCVPGDEDEAMGYVLASLLSPFAR